MSMGLCNAPGAFQRLMEIVLSGLTYDIVLVYLDDIIVFGRSFSEHLERLQSVLKRIQDANLKISPSKCNLFQKKLVFLGHVVSADGIHTDPSKTFPQFFIVTFNCRAKRPEKFNSTTS